jgi:hypothetical protein
MKKSIIEFITIAIQDWDDNSRLGEEIRGLQETLEHLVDTDTDNLIGALLMMIYLCPDDNDLGRHIRKNYIPYKLYLKHAETNP